MTKNHSRLAVKAILGRHGVDSGSAEKILDEIDSFLAVRDEIAETEKTDHARISAIAARQSVLRRFCDHWTTEKKFSHDAPAPADSWDQCVFCGEHLNFKAADRWI